jgi:hypothetical protein
MLCVILVKNPKAFENCPNRFLLLTLFTGARVKHTMSLLLKDKGRSPFVTLLWVAKRVNVTSQPVFSLVILYKQDFIDISVLISLRSASSVILLV